MIVSVPSETFPGESRVALTPAATGTLISRGHQVVVEAGAGTAAGFPDPDYIQKGARIEPDRSALFEAGEVILQVRTLGLNPERGADDLGRLRPGQTLIGMGDPLSNAEAVRTLSQRGVTVFLLELLPRISRAQAMDVLSSMANVAGYRAAILGAYHLPRMFPLQMTAAGTLPPARVLIIGAGVAGLQAIATAKRLGAVVKAYDVRPAARSEVESLGASFLEIPLETEGAEGTGGYARAMDESFYSRQRALLTSVMGETDVLITSAAVPGIRAPILITKEMVDRMKPGSVIVDLAASTGGNCEATQPDRTVIEGGVLILGPTNLPSTVAHDASLMYAKNLTTFLLHLTDKSGNLNLDLSDEITRSTLVARDGQVVHPRVRQALGLDASSA